MLIEIVEWIVQNYGDFRGAGLVNFLSFRAGVAIILSLVISMIFGGRIIDFLRRQQIGETVRDLGLDGQQEKQGTPTMGGIIIIMAIVLPCWLMARLDNIYILVMLLSTTMMAIIGFIDDYIKVFRKNKDGLAGKFKIMGQVGLGLLIGIIMLKSDQIVVRLSTEEATQLMLDESRRVSKFETIQLNDSTTVDRANYKVALTNVPFLKGNDLDYAAFVPMPLRKARKWAWLIFIPMVILVVTAVSNAANLTDGLDGLATGTSSIIGIVLAVFAYVSGNAIAADYLNILYLPGAGELVVFAACFLGACLGFLWYNSYPAQVFMGDTGSLTLGGIIAAMAILLRKELLIPLLCGIFLVENLSVILQVAYFKYTKKKTGVGKRIFLMSPLHHHFQRQGMAESKIVIRFWIVGILLAVATILTLKIR